MGKKRPLTEHERADVEHLALIFAKSMPGWNEDTAEPGIADPATRAMAEAHWVKVNEACLRSGRKLARLAVRAGYRRESTAHGDVEPASAGPRI